MARKKKVSMQTIADHLQISKNAVSLALLNKKGVSEEVRRRVIEAAKELGYGRFGEPKLPERGNILVLVPERVMDYEDNDHFQFFHDMIWGIEGSIRNRGLNAVLVRITADMEQRLELPRHCEEIAYRGIVLFGALKEAYVRRVWELDVPLVMLDSYHRSLSCPAVVSANVEGAYEAVSLLIASGHQEIGFIGPVNLASSHEERWHGYWKAMFDRDLTIQREYVLTHSGSYQDSEREIHNFLKGMDRLPQAFFCGNDRIAYLLAKELEQRGLKIPEDIALVGFDDLQYKGSIDIALTTMRVEKERMCEAAADLLLSLNGSLREAVRIYIRPTLIPRTSHLKP
ncbi:LacI family transcriptional regulator [Paenibacillus antibioticophila]|uniref:LacI family transcriptional regulator n=1 Tax=Paenibacillus antibioticophila TaxID=1274374 RepID=A0A919XXY2_9BACL|nr:LacI family DNA-binding transcriptional regulator [Paenibacillus antibioticophila]GIO40094.1 LacI family transcriptional regulator [Paenibacillus antibioticophila]